MIAELRDELPVGRELQDVTVGAGAVAADPDVALVVAVDSVVRARPLVARTVAAAPVAEQGAGLVELEDRRRHAAALAGLLVLRALERVEHVRTMDDPDVILGIHPEADRLALIPVVRQRLREGRIHFEARRLDGGRRLRLGLLFHQALGEDERAQDADEGRANQHIPFTCHVRCSSTYCSWGPTPTRQHATFTVPRARA